MESARAGPAPRGWMTQATTRQAPSLIADHEWRTRLGQTMTGGPRKRGQVAFVLLALGFTITMAGTPLPTPLYVLYQAQFHFSPLMTAIIYATYAVAVMATLLLAGQSSDQVGRQ